jgi:hypothetical protein
LAQVVLLGGHPKSPTCGHIEISRLKYQLGGMRKKNEPIIQAIRRQLGNGNEVEMVNKEWAPVGDFQVTIWLRKVNPYDAIVIGETGYLQQNQMEM